VVEEVNRMADKKSKMSAEEVMTRIFNLARGVVSPQYIKQEAKSKSPTKKMRGGKATKGRAKAMMGGKKTKGMARGGRGR